jgi:hypothetical protein
MNNRTQTWDEVTQRYEDLIQHGWEITPMLSLAKFLAHSDYAAGLFPSVALGVRPASSLIVLQLGRVPDFDTENNALIIKLHPREKVFTFTYVQRPDDRTPWTRECSVLEWQPVLERILQKRLRWFQ